MIREFLAKLPDFILMVDVNSTRDDSVIGKVARNSLEKYIWGILWQANDGQTNGSKSVYKTSELIAMKVCPMMLFS